MATDTGHVSSSNPPHPVRADTLGQVEPDEGGEFVVRPYSLTPAELGGLSAAVAGKPTHVLAWMRRPATADHVRGLALAWTPRAVYVEWQDRGTHRAWVWASAVERVREDQAATAAAPERPQASGLTLLSAEPLARLVHLVNARLAPLGAEFVTGTTRLTGPFGAVVYGSIDDHLVHLEFSTEPATNLCLIVAVSDRESLPGRNAGPTFEKAVETYPWAAVLDALG